MSALAVVFAILAHAFLTAQVETAYESGFAAVLGIASMVVAVACGIAAASS